jgi:tRNA G18 (ribose-2'-O)-methylase SpoU
MIRVDDPDDERLDGFRMRERALANRPQRRGEPGGRFLAEGDLVVERAVAAGCRPLAVLADAQRIPPVVTAIAQTSDAEIYLASDELRRRITALAVSMSVLAVFERPPALTVDEVTRGHRRLIALDGVDNPTNVGAVVRAATALGWQGLVLDHTSADPLARRALRTSMGTAVSLPFARHPDLAQWIAEVTAQGVTTLALTPHPTAETLDADLVGSPDTAVVVALGSERHGLSDDVLAACAHRVRIPMASGVDSLNVASAAAIALFELNRPS